MSALFSRLFKALGDETRLRIVALLSHGELCVCHLEEALRAVPAQGVPPPRHAPGGGRRGAPPRGDLGLLPPRPASRTPTASGSSANSSTTFAKRIRAPEGPRAPREGPRSRVLQVARRKGVVMEPYSVLFLCTGNSARSILAEALINHRGRGRFRELECRQSPHGSSAPGWQQFRLLQDY